MKHPLLKKLEGYSREQNQLLKTMDLQAKKKDYAGLSASLKTSAKLRAAVDKTIAKV